MPYIIQSHCAHCQEGDEFTIGNWVTHYGVYVCKTCCKLVNIAVEEGKCPGCGIQPAFEDYYNYCLAIPYLGTQMPFTPAPGPSCPRCQQAHLTFTNHAHLNMGAVVFNEAGAQRTWGVNYLEKAIFMNSAAPVIQEMSLDPFKVFTYFHLHIPSAPLLTRNWSYPILLDIRTHLMLRVMTQPDQFKRTQ